MITKINKIQAIKALEAGQDVYLCPCKLRFGAPWHPEYLLTQSSWIILKESTTSPSAAWDLMYNNWAFYNTSSETGRYAHYYIKS